MRTLDIGRMRRDTDSGFETMLALRGSWGRMLHIIGLAWILLLAVACATQPAGVTSTATPVPVPKPAPGASWKYAVLGDSSAWGFTKFYAEYIEADLGVQVQVLDWTRGGMTGREVLEQLRSNQQERLDVSQSQVVTFYGSPLHLIGLCIAGGIPSDKCKCSSQEVAAYKANLGSIADEILALRKGEPTIIRTYTRFMPFYRQWREQGMFDEYQRCVAALDAAILEVGKERGILVADTGLALNGPNHDQDPNDKGYISNDGIHENDVGGKIVADVFRKLGYAAIVP